MRFGASKNDTQHFLAFKKAFECQLSAPVGAHFPQVSNRDIDRSPQIDFQLRRTLGSMGTKRDDFSTQRDTPESFS